MIDTVVTTILLSLSPPAGVAPPYEFDPVTAEVTEDEDGALEVLAFDTDGRMDGAMLATPLNDHIRIDASFADGYVSFELVLLENGAGLRNVEMDLDEQVAEERVSVMLRFASVAEGAEQPITRRRCMIKFATIAALCAGAAAVPALRAGAVLPCVGSLIDTYCDCLPLLGYDPCN